MLELTLTHLFQLTHINGRKEFHGEDRVTALDLDFKGEIKDAIADKFSLDDEFFSDILWRDNEEQTVRCPQMGAFALNLNYDQHQVRLFSALLDDLPPKLILNECKIRKLKMKPKDGGVAEISFQVQGEVADNEEIGKLFNEFLGCEMKLQIQPQQTDLINQMNTEEPAESDTQQPEESGHPSKAKSAA